MIDEYGRRMARARRREMLRGVVHFLVLFLVLMIMWGALVGLVWLAISHR